jgi:hypothetical protein
VFTESSEDLLDDGGQTVKTLAFHNRDVIHDHDVL